MTTKTPNAGAYQPYTPPRPVPHPSKPPVVRPAPLPPRDSPAYREELHKAVEGGRRGHCHFVYRSLYYEDRSLAREVLPGQPR